LTDAEYVGKVVVVGVNAYDRQGQLLRQLQVHGRIKEVDTEAGIVIALHGTDEEFFLPPVFEALSKAKPGTYTARTTGAVIKDPDFRTEWNVRVDALTPEGSIEWASCMDWRPIKLTS
jgi:hypothetical protein